MYYFAFGLPSAVICMWGSTLANAALFALIFPSYIIMAMHAHPVPVDPYNPSSPPTASGAPITHPSPYMPIRLRVFAPVIFLNDCIVTVLSLCTRRHSGTRARTFSLDRGGGAKERMEEGDGEEIELRPAPRVPTLRQTAAGHRKLD